MWKEANLVQPSFCYSPISGAVRASSHTAKLADQLSPHKTSTSKTQANKVFFQP